MSGTSYRVLVAEDEATFGLTVARFLEKHGHEVKICPSAKAVFKFLAAQEWDVLLLDLKLPDAEGVDILARVRKDHAELQTIIVTGFANVQSAIDSMRLGAFDYLTKPPNFEELGMRVEKAGEKTLLERENRRLRFQVQRGMSSDILTRSPAVQKVLRTLEMVAAAKTPILIEGESGVGKELMALHLHRLSPRSSKAFVDLNCAAVPATLLESELFGHERGAFTGAGNEKPGLVEVADGGTLFLDEVGEMAPEIQSKFLRVLDSGTFYRVGATRKRRADFRLVAATNRDLAGEVQAGRFRKDLFYRIHGVKVVIPPLRDRPEDIPLLVDHFARQLPMAKRFSSGALAALASHDWPGNVRELHFAVERAGLLAEADVIDIGDLPPEILERSVQRPATGLGGMSGAGGPSPSPGPPSAPQPPAARPPAPPLDDDDDDEEDDLAFSRGGPDAARVREALEKSRWRREQAAEILGVSPRTLYRWMKRLGL
jgi:DNA-binding NtrC family response regulator